MYEQHHEMVLEMRHPSGMQGWYCPTCGRRLLMAHGPKFRKIVLEIGDENAIHSGGKDSLHTRLIPPKIVDGPLLEEATLPREDPTLAPWVAWMDEIDFESLWHDDA